MVYNAMKLFMEVNPALYDQCYANWVEAHGEKPTKEQTRKAKWDKLAAAAKSRKPNGEIAGPQPTAPADLLPVTTAMGDKIESPTSSPTKDATDGETTTVDGVSTGPYEQTNSDPMAHGRLSRFQDLSIQEASVPGALGHSQAPPRSSNLGTPSSAASHSFSEETG